MRVILLQDVPKIGHKFEQKQVSDGYALNFLIPRGLAEFASEKALTRANQAKASAETELKVKQSLLAKNLKSLEGVSLEIQAKANAKGHLFAGIHKEEIVKLLREEKHVDILPEFLMMEAPIKQVGESVFEVKAGEKSAKIKVVVKPA